MKLKIYFYSVLCNAGYAYNLDDSIESPTLILTTDHSILLFLSKQK